MKRVIYEASNGNKIESLRIDGTTIGVSGIESVTVETDCGLWDVIFKGGVTIHSTGNVFICLKPLT